MKIVRTNFFNKQIKDLSKKFSKIENDFNFFEDNFSLEPFSDLGGGIFKYRIKNSSIPVGKRGGFRIIVKVYNNKILPILIYSKNIKDNVSYKEIISAFESIVKEL